MKERLTSAQRVDQKGSMTRLTRASAWSCRWFHWIAVPLLIWAWILFFL